MTSGNLSSFQSKRSFELWSYGVSHQRLLLRSGRSHKFGTTVDVLLQEVTWLQLPIGFTGLEISRLESWSDSSCPHLSTVSLKHRALWSVRYDGGEGFVVAGSLFAIETERNWDEPSPLVEEWLVPPQL
jgi:hypothetical protein